ncbi:hypothetical protein HG530_013280 [Fusarium avenaceum]|nr:hypothetical protein HG530_013280 [Fusarium avenaceum]
MRENPLDAGSHVTSVTASLLGLAASLGGLGRGRGLSLDGSRRSLGLDGGGGGLVASRGGLDGSGSGGTGSGSLSLGGGLRGGRRAGAGAGATDGQLGTGDGVAGGVVVEIEDDTLLGGSVQRSTGNTGGLLSTGTSDLEVEALGVVLGTVLLASSVESNDLVTEDVRTGLEAGGDGDLPGVASGNEVVGGELATGGHTGLGDLEELEVGLVDLGAAIGTARSEVVDDGTLVRLGPGVPLDGDLLTGLDAGGLDSVLGALVADDVGVTEGGGLNEAVVGVGGEPSDELLGRVVVGGRARVEALKSLAPDADRLNVAVGGNADSTGKGGEEGLGGERRHLEG